MEHKHEGAKSLLNPCTSSWRNELDVNSMMKLMDGILSSAHIKLHKSVFHTSIGTTFLKANDCDALKMPNLKKSIAFQKRLFGGHAPQVPGEIAFPSSFSCTPLKYWEGKT